MGRQLGIASHFARLDAEKNSSKLLTSKASSISKKQAAEGRGVFIFSGHFGGWEILFSSLPVIGHPASYIIRRIDNPLVEEYAENFRAKFGNRVIDRKDSAKRTAAEILKNGGKIYILPDVNWQERGRFL